MKRDHPKSALQLVFFRVGSGPIDNLHRRGGDHCETCPFISSGVASRQFHPATLICESPVKILGCELKSVRNQVRRIVWCPRPEILVEMVDNGERGLNQD